MTFEHVAVETIGAVGVITLTRPKALNALSDALMDELGAALQAFDADEAIGCLVLTGGDKVFAAGADVSAMAEWTYMDVFKRDFITRNWETLRRVRKPVIAAVAGYALGGGCELAMMCDIVIAADNAKFGQPEVQLGIIPGAGGTQRLPRAIGKAKAMDLCLTGRMMDAVEAERAGLVSRVVPADRLRDEALEAAATDRVVLAAGDDDDQGVDQPRLRVAVVRGAAVRAPALPRDVRDGRPEGGHGRLRGQTACKLQEFLIESHSTADTVRRWAKTPECARDHAFVAPPDLTG